MAETPTRTPGQTRRRRALIKAAAGRTTVVIYACSTDPRTSGAAVVTALRRYATARDWDIAEVIVDPSPMGTPLYEREQWTAVRDAIADGRAEGIVALRGHTCIADTNTHAELMDWLAQHAGFLSVVESSPRDCTWSRP